jgi:hypothetical protein
MAPRPTTPLAGLLLARLLEKLRRCFLSWVQAISDVKEGKVATVNGNDLPVPM